MANAEDRPLTPGQIRRMTRDSVDRSQERRAKAMRPGARFAAWLSISAAVSTLGILGLRANSGNSGSAASPEGSQDNVPAATIDYLKTRPTVEVTLGQGEGLDAAAYAANPDTFDATTPDIREGVTQILEHEVATTAPAGDMPQAGEAVSVPVVPPTESVPPDAR